MNHHTTSTTHSFNNLFGPIFASDMRYLVIEGDKTPPFQVADILGGDNNMRFSNIFEKYIAC